MSSIRDSGGHNENSRDESEITESDLNNIVALLCDGDITKRDMVLWNIQIEGIKPYVEIQIEKQKFRKSVMAFLGVKEKHDTDPTDKEYLDSIKHFKHRKKDGKHS